jgi:hypothetical protein
MAAHAALFLAVREGASPALRETPRLFAKILFTFVAVEELRQAAAGSGFVAS